MATKTSKSAAGAKAAAPIRPTASLQFTRDGKPIGRPVPAPPGANDLHLVWEIPPGVIVKAWWTRSGRRIEPPISVPKGANDAHLKISGGIIGTAQK